MKSQNVGQCHWLHSIPDFVPQTFCLDRYAVKINYDGNHSHCILISS